MLTKNIHHGHRSYITRRSASRNCGQGESDASSSIMTDIMATIAILALVTASISFISIAAPKKSENESAKITLPADQALPINDIAIKVRNNKIYVNNQSNAIPLNELSQTLNKLKHARTKSISLVVNTSLLATPTEYTLGIMQAAQEAGLEVDIIPGE